MYFDSVLYYLARAINDISLMNFSGPPSRFALVYQNGPLFSFFPVYSSGSQFQKTHPFNLFFSPFQYLPVRSPSFGIAKVEKILPLSRTFLKFFFRASSFKTLSNTISRSPTQPFNH